MSYILEALKKAEQKTEGLVPNLLSHPGPTTEPKRRPLWPYPLIAVLLLNAGMIVWWTHSRSPDERQIPVQPPALHQQSPVAPAEPSVKTGEPDGSTNVKEIAKEAAPGKPQARLLQKEERHAPLPDIEKSRAASSPPAQPQTRAENKATPRGRVFTLDELPSTVRSSLPGFKVSGHAYSPDPGSRVARINDQILQEGQSLSPGLKVEEITPSGIILSHKGYRFQIDISAN